MARRGGREQRPDVEVAIIHRPRYDDWSLPKGKLAPGESHLEGAMREVHEETGYRVQPGRSLGEVRYLKESGGGRAREGRPLLGDEGDRRRVQPQPRGRRLRWLSIDEARERSRAASTARCWSASRSGPR